MVFSTGCMQRVVRKTSFSEFLSCFHPMIPCDTLPCISIRSQCSSVSRFPSIAFSIISASSLKQPISTSGVTARSLCIKAVMNACDSQDGNTLTSLNPFAIIPLTADHSSSPKSGCIVGTLSVSPDVLNKYISDRGHQQQDQDSCSWGSRTSDFFSLVAS